MVVTMVHFFLLQLETFSAARMKLNFRYIGSAPHDSTADWIILSVKRHLHSRSPLYSWTVQSPHRKYSIKIYFFLLFLLLSSKVRARLLPTGYYNLLHNCPQTDGAGAGERRGSVPWAVIRPRHSARQNRRRAIRDNIINNKISFPSFEKSVQRLLCFIVS